ncbi:trafficking kinesin-binding protein milt isoform X2 [Cimex lectularius]|uniref:Trafficking kinesin-binding protein milt n=1 Tax=Cimex lectularius TaxID=79782 RepID=A0A8I6S3U0_CIMLE|nr:trafficking kinesin-binding protein milt isoform X2 [Cimex lectularius]
MLIPKLNKVVCSDRISQMSRTYNDIEAVTRLLEEKEKDIELTARLGQELLAQNSKLEAKIEQLENELRISNEKTIQLSHDLQKKSEIIQILTNDIDDSGSEAGTPTGVKFETLKNRIDKLEIENKSLKKETFRLAEETEKCEEAEAKLVEDLVAQLDLCRMDLATAGIEGEKIKQKESELKEQVDHLEAKLEATGERLEQALQENEELLKMVTISRETQCELATELVEVKEKYSELVALVDEWRENTKKTKKQSQLSVRVGPVYSSLMQNATNYNPDSIAAELECSLLSELSLDSGLGASSTGGVLPNYKKVFETFKMASHSSSIGGSTSQTPAPMPTLGGTVLSSSTVLPTSILPVSGIDSFSASSVVSDTEEDLKTFKAELTPNKEEVLQAALSRLSISDLEARRTALSRGALPNYSDDYSAPDSIMSISITSPYTGWKLPEKLQIVKPIEGSQTLHHWSELATPSMDGLLEEQPGIKIRGGTDLEALGLQMCTLSDIEEDDEIHPGKSFSNTSHVYTFTNSTVMHPDDNTHVTSTLRGSQMTTASSSRVSSIASTPVTRSRRNSTSTVSTAPGLARLLAERGIKAATPSTLVTPEYSPTATPCNSPERCSSPTPDDESHSSLGLPGFLMSSGAELLWKALGSALKSPAPQVKNSSPAKKGLLRPDKKAALTGIRLVERIERIGLEEILATSGGTGGTVAEPGSPRTLHRAGLRRTVRSFEKGPGVLGVPGRPGTGALEARLAHIPAPGQGGRVVRPDLGSVPSPPGLAPSHESLGTLSSIFFGRKGGLL